MVSDSVDLVFFSDDRSGVPTSSMHLADQLAKKRRVFWLNTYTRMPALSWHDFSKAAKILFGRSGKTAKRPENEEQADTIRYLTPKTIPWFIPPIRKINGILGRCFLKKLFRDADIQSPVLVTTFPCTVDTFRAVRSETKQVYYCVDEWSEYPGLDRRRWGIMERELLRCVDGVAFTSRDLMDRKKQNAKQSLYLPHGVDFDHFSGTNVQRAFAKIDLLESLPKPIIGFFGTMDSWVDLAAISALAQRFPKYSFVVIGGARISTDVLQSSPNIHLLGPIPYAKLPGYASYFDVGLIPFVLNDLTKAVNPLKLMEYFAIGVPVISTRLPDILNVPGPLYFAENHDEFGDRLEEILRNDLPTLKRSAQEIAQQNSWASRAEKLLKFIDDATTR